MGKLLGPGGVEALRSVLPGGMGRRRRGLFPQAGGSAEGGQGGVGTRGDAVEFGYCFDVSVGDVMGFLMCEEGKRDDRNANDLVGGFTGSDTSVLPRVGDVICCAVRAVAADIAG